MAKIGLAAELAKQAAQAAREEVAAAEAAKPAATPKGWTVPRLPDDFALDDAMQLATNRVAGHYRQVLAPQGLDVGLEELAPQSVTDETQGVGGLQAHLREQGSGKVVRTYTTPAFLTMYAAQQQATGIVVDGQV